MHQSFNPLQSRRAFLIPWKEVINMIKVRILDRCEFCDGEAYIYDCQDVDTQGEAYDRYRPCEMCHGCDIWTKSG
jgi:RecJ-like exonuclease